MFRVRKKEIVPLARLNEIWRNQALTSEGVKPGMAEIKSVLVTWPDSVWLLKGNVSKESVNGGRLTSSPMLMLLCTCAESLVGPGRLRLLGISSKRQRMTLIVKRGAQAMSRGRYPRADESSMLLWRYRMEFPAATNIWTNTSLSKDGASLKSKV